MRGALDLSNERILNPMSVEPTISPPRVESVAALRDPLLDPALWQASLEQYARAMRLAVALADAEGRLLGPCINPQPLWSLLHARKPPQSAACPFDLTPLAPCTCIADALRNGAPVMARDRSGLVHFAAPLILNGQHLGSLLAGQVFDRYPEQLPLEQAAKRLGLSPLRVWQAARRERPLSRSTLQVYAELLASFADAFLQTRSHAILEERRAAERRRADELLRAERDFAQGLIETAEAIVLVLSPEGRVVRFNPYFEELSGYAMEEVRGKDWFATFLPESECARIRAVVLRVAAGMEAKWSECPIVTKDGRERAIRWSSRALKDARGNTTGVLTIGHDITDLKEAQQRSLRAERLAAIGKTVTGLAHEGRNALQQIQACVELLTLDLHDRPETLEIVADIQKAQDRLHYLFEDVREYAAPIKLARVFCNLPAIWREAWAQLAAARKGRDARLREETGGRDWACLADPLRIEQIFRNILENSLAACRDPVLLEIACSEAELDEQPAVQIAIRDRGPGLSAEQRAKIFEPFYTTKTRGTGLGMSIVLRIVEAHGGRIALGAGPGTEIRITLPQRKG